MNRDEAKRILFKLKIEIDDDRLYLNREQVGKLRKDTAVFSNCFPSLYNAQYRDMKKSIVDLKSPDAEDAIVSAITWITSSPSRFEKFMRAKRVGQIKQYFKQRKIEKLINDIPAEDPL